MLVNLENGDGLDLVDELAAIEEEYVSMESVVFELDAMAKKISLEGICRADASALLTRDTTLLTSAFPLNSFTLSPSRTNMKPALEGIFDKTREIIVSIFEAIAKFIKKVVNWLITLISRKNHKKEILEADKDLSSAYQKKSKDAEEVIRDVNKDAKQTAEVKAAEESRVRDVVSGIDPVLKDYVEKAKNSYSVLARAATYQPETISKLLDYYTEIPNLGMVMGSIVGALETTLDTYDRDPTLENLTMAGFTASNLEANLAKSLKVIASKLHRVKLTGIDFGDFNMDEPDQYLSEVRNALFKAAQTPSGTSLREDFGDDYRAASNSRVDIADTLAKAQVSLDSGIFIYKRLNVAVKRLRKMMPRLKRLGAANASEQIEAREKLIAINRLMRRSILAYIRLREIPGLVFNSVLKNTVAETELNHVMSKQIKK